MNRKSCSIDINDILDELKEEINRLSNDLSFERKLNSILDNIRSFSLILVNYDKDHQNSDLFNKFMELNAVYVKLLGSGEDTYPEQRPDNVFDAEDFDNQWTKEVVECDVFWSETEPQSSETTPIYNPPRDGSDSSMDSFHTPMQTSDDERSDNDLLESEALVPQNNITIKSEPRETIGEFFHEDTDNHSYVCRPCKQLFDNINVFVSHLSEHSPQRFVERSIADESGLDSSLNISLADEEYKCEECEAKLVGMVEYETHFNRDHFNVKPFKCQKCRQRFYAKDSLCDHLGAVHKVRAFECHLCNYKGRAKTNLLMHMTNHSSEKPYVCSWKGCPKRFWTSELMSQHKRTVHRLSMRESMGLPLIDVKPGNKRAERKAKLRTITAKKSSHQKYERNISKPWFTFFKCEHCYMKFRTEDKLELHVNKEHLNFTPYRCGHCDQQFYTKNSLGSHLYNKHRIAGFECHICGQKQAQRVLLDKHMKIHFVCNFDGCVDRRFKSQSTLNWHLNNWHTNSDNHHKFDLQLTTIKTEESWM